MSISPSCICQCDLSPFGVILKALLLDLFRPFRVMQNVTNKPYCHILTSGMLFSFVGIPMLAGEPPIRLALWRATRPMLRTKVRSCVLVPPVALALLGGKPSNASAYDVKDCRPTLASRVAKTLRFRRGLLSNSTTLDGNAACSKTLKLWKV